ncbi:GlsB/YeaQ/YmgE family stress response membrane protein [Roseivivax marinus]|uniref:GlsB/YeaQ/YmgE family stress response membrane protein n=1 Tax=Roseivivax marinus TaxID=1379903 RepID=UPI001F034EB9|nr:GlsB/YeaQ/YmgE family stress response membrane protein [Roseivivax marinus]UMA64501.1 GlsB/YeaQ/YmgE family stress response membrane protein [Roseivivax marinus]
MEGLLDAIGALALVLLIAVGLAAGFLAGKIAGRNMALYLVVGVVAAVATPFVLAALGLGILAAGGLLLIALVAAIGAVVVLALVRMATRRNE